jgi:ATP-dependent DNA helicase RecQ
MNIKNTEIHKKATEGIKALYGNNAEFREGQYEAIEATLQNNRTLVVQKTGWGKSLVYFLCTKLLREKGRGVTIVVSPLLVLMENQINAAEKLGLKCDVLNSAVLDRRGEIISSLSNDELDLVLVTPEALLREDVQRALPDIKIGLFVIDEAHCISDWGHDFRLDYSNIHKILRVMSHNVPVLATTATANNRVIEDLSVQLAGASVGANHKVYVSRGALMRKSLSIQVLRLKDKAYRYAWILENIKKIPGSGIIYCLTQRDCDYLTDFLISHNIEVMSYYSRGSDNKDGELKNKEAEELFASNKIKAIVATVKLGMGYDKGDVSFVIHFQQPANIVSYYQQIGRAGRSIDRAYTFIMTSSEDKKILDYFINTAFPTQEEANSIISCISDSSEKGVSLGEINASVNCKKSRIDKTLSFLLSEGFIVKEKSRFYTTLKDFKYNSEHYNAVKEMRRKEQLQMSELFETNQCCLKFIANCLDDDTNESCTICSNCLGYDEFPSKISEEYLEKALIYIERMLTQIKPRKKWATTCYTKQTTIPYQNQTGICLSRYGDVGYGELVKKDKCSKSGQFRDELVGKSSQVLSPLINNNSIDVITCVPSLRSSMVENFAKRLAVSCGVRFMRLLETTSTLQQKDLLNSSHQCENAYKSFRVIHGIELPKNVILIDALVDSRWTLTVCGFRLMEAGCEKVFPFTLADNSQLT